MRFPILTSLCAGTLLAFAPQQADAQRLPILPNDVQLTEPLARNDALTPRYFLGSLVASGFGSGAIALTANPGVWTPAKRWHAWLGITSGAAALALGAAEIDARGDRRTLAAINGIVGTASFTLGLRALLTAGEAERRMAERLFAVTPAVTVSRDANGENAAAVGGVVRMRF